MVEAKCSPMSWTINYFLVIISHWAFNLFKKLGLSSNQHRAAAPWSQEQNLRLSCLAIWEIERVVVLWWPYVGRAQSVYNGAYTCDRICMPYSGLIQYTGRVQAVNKTYMSGLIVAVYTCTGRSWSTNFHAIHAKGCGQLAELGQNLSKNTLISIVKSLWIYGGAAKTDLVMIVQVSKLGNKGWN